VYALRGSGLSWTSTITARSGAAGSPSRTVASHRWSAEVDKYFAGLELIPPGLVEITTWRPEGTAAEEQTYDWIEYGGVARKTR
jgi:hypothetical protein